MRPILHTFITALCLVMLAGCGVTKPSRYYLLTPTDEISTGTPGIQAPAVGIGPVTFPVYLDRPEIVLRIDGNQLQYAEFHRWAQPLKTAFSHSLSENLSIMLPTDRTVVFPWPRSTALDYQLVVNVTRFEANADGTVILTAGWELTRSSDSTVLKRNKTTYAESADGNDYPAIVAAQSRALERLSRDISEAIVESGLSADQQE